MNSLGMVRVRLAGAAHGLHTRPAAGAWRRWLWQGALSTAAAIIAVAAMRPLRGDLGLFNVALILLLLSVIAAAACGWVVGLYTSVLCNLLFNYFFVPPLYQFSVQLPENALVLALFLVVAAITASLLARSRQHAIAAEEQARAMEELLDANRRNAEELERRARETQTLLALSRTARDTPLDEIPAAICALAVRDLGLLACTLYRFEGDELVPVAHAGADAQTLSRAERSVAIQAAQSGVAAGLGYGRTRVMRLPGQGQAESGRLFLPLGVEGGVAGVLRLRTAGGPLSRAQEALLEGFADEAASALHRASLAASARTAAVLQETDRLRSALLSSVSHDLRTPLTAIKAAAANLMSPDVDWSAEARQEFLLAIDRETDRLTRLVTNLLDLSRIEAGALRLDLDWNDLEELLRNAIYRTERVAPDRRVELTIDGGPVPLLRFDYLQLDRVLANLLDNAVKYSPPGTPITVRARMEENAVRVSVSDRGAGIPPQERARVFDPFYRVAGSDGAGGSGLGLAICRGIVEAHGGVIAVEDSTVAEQEVGGTTVCFTLPRAPDVEPAAPVELRASGAVASRSAGSVSAPNGV